MIVEVGLTPEDSISVGIINGSACLQIGKDIFISCNRKHVEALVADCREELEREDKLNEQKNGVKSEA
jgi:hypothetical protein